MMIEDDHIDSPALKPSDGFDGGGAAIDGEEQAARMFLQTIGRTIGTQAVAFIHAVGQIGLHLPTEASHPLAEQRARTHTIDIVVAEENEAFAGTAGHDEAFDRASHSGKQERIPEALEHGVEKSGGPGRIGKAAIEQAARKQGLDVELPHQPRNGRRFRFGDDPPVAVRVHQGPPEKSFCTNAFTPPTPRSEMRVSRTANAAVVRKLIP